MTYKADVGTYVHCPKCKKTSETIPVSSIHFWNFEAAKIAWNKDYVEYFIIESLEGEDLEVLGIALTQEECDRLSAIAKPIVEQEGKTICIWKEKTPRAWLPSLRVGLFNMDIDKL